MPLPFLKKRQPEKAVIALDLGTETVKAMLFTIEERHSAGGEVIGRRAVVKGVGRVAQRPADSPSHTVTDIASVVKNAKEAIRTASREAGMNPRQLVMGVSGEIVKGATSVITCRREDEGAKINVSELRNIVHKLEWKAFADVRKAIGEETGYPEIDIKLVGSSIVDVRIDGYRVTNLMGFQGKEVQMSIFNSFAPLGHHAALQQIADELGLELLGIVSEPFALSRCLGADEGDPSAIFIDVGGGGTSVAAISGGSVISSKMFGIGGRAFTKRLSVELNISPQEAEQLKLAYTADKLEPKSKKIIGSIFGEDVEFWLEGVVLAMSEFKQMETLPSKIFLCGGGAYLPEIKEALNTRKWYKKLPFQRTPQATFLTQKQIRHVIDETKKISDQEDIVPLALVNAGIELAGEETVLQKVLRKVIGIMQV